MGLADMEARLIVFDDSRARAWEPLALTRPVGELLLGGSKIVEWIERATGLDCAGYITSPHLIDFREQGARFSLPPASTSTESTLFWCSRAIPEPGESIEANPGSAYVIDGHVVGYMDHGGSEPGDRFLETLDPPSSASSTREVRGQVFEWLWDLLAAMPGRLRDEFQDNPDDRDRLPAGAHALGDGALSLGDGVRIEPGVVFDLSGGPIRIDGSVEIRAGTRLSGPARIGSHSKLLGGSFESVACGPHSYLRGEVAHSVILGHTNKAHDGYLGHAYAGRWVNLGALTTNSDLKNNYHSVRVWTPSGPVDTGLTKVGCFLGDHVKTGIGTMLGTGTVMGAGANVYGAQMPPAHVPPFSWGQGEDLGEYRLDAFLDTAERAMKRRGVELDEGGRRYLESCWRKGRGG